MGNICTICCPGLIYGGSVDPRRRKKAQDAREEQKLRGQGENSTEEGKKSDNGKSKEQVEVNPNNQNDDSAWNVPNVLPDTISKQPNEEQEAQADVTNKNQNDNSNLSIDLASFGENSIVVPTSVISPPQMVPQIHQNDKTYKKTEFISLGLEPTINENTISGGQPSFGGTSTDIPKIQIVENIQVVEVETEKSFSRGAVEFCSELDNNESRVTDNPGCTEESNPTTSQAKLKQVVLDDIVEAVEFEDCFADTEELYISRDYPSSSEEGDNISISKNLPSESSASSDGEVDAEVDYVVAEISQENEDPDHQKLDELNDEIAMKLEDSIAEHEKQPKHLEKTEPVVRFGTGNAIKINENDQLNHGEIKPEPHDVGSMVEDNSEKPSETKEHKVENSIKPSSGYTVVFPTKVVPPKIVVNTESKQTQKPYTIVFKH